MKGILLCGGKGTRLLPSTKITNKHLIPILNKPMVLYPLDILKRMGLKDILIVSGGEHIGAFAEFLQDGKEYGVDITYKVQTNPGGIAQALSLAEDFSNGESIAVILGDNIFDTSIIDYLRDSMKHLSLGEWGDGAAIIVTKDIENAKRFGVLTKGENGKMWVEEKPENPKSNEVLTGLYIYPSDVFNFIRTLIPSKRDELEIASVNSYYIENNRAIIVNFKGFWSDAGTPESLAEVTQWALKHL